MRAVYFKNGELELRDIPRVPDEGIRVHVRSVGICSSDLHMLEGKFPVECIAGHEVAGVLDDGSPVAVEPVVVPARCLVHLPANVDVRDACLAEPLAVVVHGMRRAGLEGGQRVAVIGGGTTGLCAVAVARASHAMVGLAARYAHQVTAGELPGAKEIEGQYDLVVECAGTEKAVSQAIKLCRPKGKILMLSTHWSGLTLSQMAAQRKEIIIVLSSMYTSSSPGRDFDVAAMLLAGNPEIAKALITHRYPLAEVKQAFAVARDRKAGAIKVVLEP
ncbi:MAG: zinc-binding dehydrogenase [Chloroflexi bacterium]|nr:zinc-binding dehydrogenase [Chloroflexota bacterium]